MITAVSQVQSLARECLQAMGVAKKKKKKKKKERSLISCPTFNIVVRQGKVRCGISQLKMWGVEAEDLHRGAL